MTGQQPVLYRVNERIGRTSQPLVQRQYHELDLVSRVESASPVALVSMLYDELATAFNVTRSALANGRIETANIQSDRAQSILLSLIASLDLKNGGSLARELGNVYHAMLSTVRRLDRTRDVRLLEELISGLANIRESWDAIAATE